MNRQSKETIQINMTSSLNLNANNVMENVVTIGTNMHFLWNSN